MWININKYRNIVITSQSVALQITRLGYFPVKLKQGTEAFSDIKGNIKQPSRVFYLNTMIWNKKNLSMECSYPLLS